MLESFAIYSGVIATIWITVGVYIAGKFYCGYNHQKQFCSELGASGSPTEKLSPIINNYPLGALFCLFGAYLVLLPNSSVLINLAGWLIIIHGISTWVAGYFPMDADPYTREPTLHCKIHSWAGFIMFLSLLIAPILVAISPTTSTINMTFKVFSIASVIVAIYYLIVMAKVFKSKGNVGTYQRISYGVQLLWLSTFSVILAL